MASLLSSTPTAYRTTVYDPVPTASEGRTRGFVALAATLGIAAGVAAFCLTAGPQAPALYAAAPVTHVRAQPVGLPATGSLRHAAQMQLPLRSTAGPEFAMTDAVQDPLQDTIATAHAVPPTWSHGLTIVASVFAGLGFALWHSKRAGAPTSSRLMAASMDVDLVPAPVAMVAASGRKSDLDPLSSAVEADVPTRQSAHPFDPLGLAERHNVEESEWYPGAQAAHARWALLTELGRSHTGVLKEYAEHMFQDCSLLTPETSEGKVAMLATGGKSSVTAKTEEPPGIGDFFGGDLPGKFLTLLALLAISRVGVYIPLPGVDVERFADAIQSSGMMGYVDTLSGGSISKLGIFSLGIIPYINASIIIQLAVQLNPELKKIQREEGERGRNKIKNYMRVGALGFAIIQSFGQCTFIRPYVDDFTIQWLAQSIGLLTGGAMGLVFISERLDKLKLGNGTSLMIFANIVSALPGSIGTALKQSQEAGNTSALAVFFAAFAAVALGIVYVQEAERKIPIVYASKFRAGGLSQRAYLPFKVNAAGVMPIIFASSILALPSTIARFMNNESIMNFARAVAPGGNIYIPLNVTMIAFFNYFYTFLQLDPNDVSEQLKKQGASIPGIRPGKSTEEYISGTLERMSVLGSGFLGALALAPSLVEATTHLTVLRGFGGTSLLILVGVATDTARKIQSEMVMQKYKTSLDNLYESENLDNL